MKNKMTTAEMVKYMKQEASDNDLLADCLRDQAPTSANMTARRAVAFYAIAARLEALESLYAKAWAECEEWRKYRGVFDDGGKWKSMSPLGLGLRTMCNADAHDAVRKEAGL